MRTLRMHLRSRRRRRERPLAGQVVDTYPFDGGGELEMIVLRLRRFGERRMLPVSELRMEDGRIVLPVHAACRSRTRRAQHRPPRGRGPVAREDLLVLRGLRGRARLGARAAKVRGAMAPQLWLLRHGEAVPHDSKPDHGAELTARGERQGARRGRGARPARGGARRLLREPEGAGARDGEARVPRARRGADRRGGGRLRLQPRRRARAAARHGDDARVLVVGHEPDFSQVVYDLTGGRVDFKKGGVAAVRAGRRPRASCSCCCARASSSRSRPGG